jgi:multidrug resistance protein
MLWVSWECPKIFFPCIVPAPWGVLVLTSLTAPFRCFVASVSTLSALLVVIRSLHRVISKSKSGVATMSSVVSKEVDGMASPHEKATSEDDVKINNSRSSISSVASTTPDTASEEIISIHQTLSRNAGLSEPQDKSLAAITTVTTNMTTDPRFEIDFDETDNPQDWSMAKKSLIIFFMSFSTLVVVMYSTSYTAGIPGMMETFNVSSKTELVVGVTTYLFGMATGSLILAPLSEMYGRRPVYLIAVFLFTVMIVPCALAENLATVLAVRFFGAMCGSAMISNAPGTVADIVDEDHRALAFSAWSIGPMNGPVVGPLVGGFVFQYMGWRWTNWVVMIGSGVSWFMVFCTSNHHVFSSLTTNFATVISETYAPAILRAKSAKKRKETGDERWYSRYDDKKGFWPMLKENLTRPLEMSVKEPIWYANSTSNPFQLSRSNNPTVSSGTST